MSTEQLPFLVWMNYISEPKNLSSSHNLGIIIPRYENVTLKLEIVCVSSSNQCEKQSKVSDIIIWSLHPLLEK